MSNNSNVPHEQKDRKGDATPLNIPWPWSVFAASLERADAAGKKEWAAQVAGDTRAQYEAGWEKAEALGDRERIRKYLCDLFFACARIAREEKPGDFAALLADLPVLELYRVEIESLEGRAGQLEEAFLRLVAGRGGQAA